MTLETHIQTHLEKLQARLAKQGVSNVMLMDYDAYLRSTLWKEIKAWILQRDDDTCRICRNRKRGKLIEYDVHHRNYDLSTMEGRDDSQLVTLCRRCHEKVEYAPGRQKRYDLKLKDAEYLRLVHLHQRIVDEGLPVSIEEVSRLGSVTYRLVYTGPKEFLEFYAVDVLMRRFALQSDRRSTYNLRIPMPFGADKFRQPSGAPMIDRETNKVAIRITCTDDIATLKVSSICRMPVREHLQAVIHEAEYWREA